MSSPAIVADRRADRVTRPWHRPRARIAAAAAGAALALLPLPAYAASGDHVDGTWQTLVPAALTSFTPSTGDPTRGASHCRRLDGVAGEVDRRHHLHDERHDRPAHERELGRSAGDLHPNHRRRSVAAGEVGTLVLTERFTLDAAGGLQIRCRIVDGTGSFAGSRGHVDFEGQMISVVEGSGTYAGTWTHA